MSALYLSVRSLPTEADIPALRGCLETAFPGMENAAYLDALGRSPLPGVTAARLSALALLPTLMGEAGLCTEGLNLMRNGHGRPFVTDAAGACPFDYNLSHSASHVACALLIGGGQVGVDVEEPIPPARAEALARRYATAEERALMACGLDFTDIWTRREALGKQAGCGRPLSFDATGIPFDVRLLVATLSDTSARLALCLPADDVTVYLSRASLPCTLVEVPANE